MSDTGFTMVQYHDALGIRIRGAYQQEIRVRLSDLPALIAEIVGAVPRNSRGATLIDQIIAAARARRPRDHTNTQRQRRFRQRQCARPRAVHSSVKEITPA